MTETLPTEDKGEAKAEAAGPVPNKASDSPPPNSDVVAEVSPKEEPKTQVPDPDVRLDQPAATAEPETKLQRLEQVKDTKLFQKFLAKEKRDARLKDHPLPRHSPPSSEAKDRNGETAGAADHLLEPDQDRPKLTQSEPQFPPPRARPAAKRNYLDQDQSAEEPRRAEVSMLSNDQELAGVTEQVPLSVPNASSYQPMAMSMPGPMPMYAPQSYPMMPGPYYPLMGYPQTMYSGAMFAQGNPYMMPPPPARDTSAELREEIERLRDELAEAKEKCEGAKENSQLAEEVEAKIREIEQSWEEKLKLKEADTRAGEELLRAEIETLKKENEELTLKGREETAKKEDEAAKTAGGLKEQVRERDAKVEELAAETSRLKKINEQLKSQVAELEYDKVMRITV